MVVDVHECDVHTDNSPWLSDMLYAGALASSAGAALAFFAQFVLRLGLGDSPKQIGIVFLLSIAPFWLTAGAVSVWGYRPSAAAISATVAILGSTLLPLLGLVAGGSVVVATLGSLILLSLWSGRGALWRALTHAKRSMSLAAIIIGFLLIVFTAPLRFYLPEELALGLATTDNYWHAAIAQMIRHYGAVSIGADGLVTQKFHFLMHALIAAFSKTSNAAVPVVYSYWSGLTIKLLLVWSTFCATLLLYPTDRKKSLESFVWRFVFAWLAAVLVRGFEVETFVLGDALFFAVLPVLLLLLRAKPGDKVAGLALVSCAAIFVCALAKLTLAYYEAIGLILAFWNFRARFRYALLFGTTLVGLLLFAHYLIVPPELYLTHTTLSIFVSSYLIYFERGVLMHYALPALLVAIYLWQPRAALKAANSAIELGFHAKMPQPGLQALPYPWMRRMGGLSRALNYFFMLGSDAQYIFLALLGGLFVLVAVPIGDNVWDFSAGLYSLSLLLLPLVLDETMNIRLDQRPVKWILALGLGYSVVVASPGVLVDGAGSLLRTIVTLHGAASGRASDENSGTKDAVLASLRQTRTPFAVLRKLVEGSPTARLAKDIERQAQLANGRLIVHIPPDANEVWHHLEFGSPTKWCMTGHLVVPAETGVAEIRSIAPDSIESQCRPPGLIWYGFGRFQELHRTKLFSHEQICAIAKSANADKIYRLESYNDLSKNSIEDCQ